MNDKRNNVIVQLLELSDDDLDYVIEAAEKLRDRSDKREAVPFEAASRWVLFGKPHRAND